MVQSIITGAIVLLAVAAAIILIIKRLKKTNKKNPCEGCSTDCGDCNLKKEIMKKGWK